MEDPFLGRWRITAMEQWDNDYIDLVVPGYFEFGEDRLGYFQFGVVEGNIDYRIEDIGRETRLDSCAPCVRRGSACRPSLA